VLVNTRSQLTHALRAPRLPYALPSALQYFNWYNQSAWDDYYALDFLTMIQTLQALPTRPKVMVNIPPPLCSPYPFEMSSDVINFLFPSLVPKIAALAFNVTVVDVFAALGGANCTVPGLANTTCDGCHPNVPAAHILAETVAAAIKAQGY
jgi:lysophospholipase L1-like esterase